jgi:branched-chain amino acid transport system substrate-binding protein
VVIASVGTLSGPAGATIGTVTKGAQLWVAYINQRGGLNGHPVKYLVRDDGADPARHRALKQQSIEQDHAVAFLADAEGITGKSAVEYVQSKRVPVIGSEGGQEYFYKNPMFFPQASHGDSFAFPVAAAPAGVFVPQGKTKLGVLVCAEVELCGIVGGIVEKSAKALGFEIVYKGKASLAQPDFTAECLANRNAGAQVMVVIMDTNSLGRFASSCARQGFRPSFAELGSMQRLDQRGDANLVGMVASSNVFPYFQTGTPAADEFQAALKAQGSGLEPGIGLTQGWVAGKVLEKAAANLPEPPTSEAVLNGLWSFKDETLGGITAPLTFVKEQPAKRSTCWFTLQVSEKHEWVSPDGYKLNCQDLPYQP